MPSAEERFRAKVVRRGGHEVWTGSTDHRGVGMVRIDGKLRTVQRAAWEFAHGPLPQGARVNTCAGERACVRIEHLSVAGTPGDGRRAARRASGSGSIRQVRPGVYEITVSDQTSPDGRPHRRWATVHGDRNAAEQELARLASARRRDLGDLRVRELVGRLLEERARDGERGVEHDWQVLHEVLGPALGDEPAAELSPIDVEHAMRPIYLSLGADATRRSLGLLRDAYRWAIRQHWCTDNPTDGITIRDLM
jgi:hypothetical protein